MAKAVWETWGLVPGRELEDTVQSASSSLTIQCRDMSEDHRDAWVYGILVGWGSAVDEVASKHGWSAEDVLRLKNMHSAVARLLGEAK